MSDKDLWSALLENAEVRVMRQHSEQSENLKESRKHYYEWFKSERSGMIILLCKTCAKLAHDCERWRENDTELMEFVI